MTLYSALFPDVATLISRRWCKAGSVTFPVPVGALWMRAAAIGAGGYGDQYGGGGAYARTRRMVTPGQTVVMFSGLTSTQSSQGDSYLTVNGTYVLLAARGRGNGAGGLASDCIGDIARSGANAPLDGSGSGGLPADDVLDAETLFGSGSALPSYVTAGGGGHLEYRQASDDGSLVRYGRPGGLGIVCAEFFDLDPGL